MTCPQCGSAVDPGAAFCGECGGPLQVHDTREEPMRAALEAPSGAVPVGTVPGGPLSAALRASNPAGAAPAGPPAPAAVALAPLAGAPRDKRGEMGSVVDGKYQIDRVLGEGGMGVVYLATDVHTGTPVVLKAIRPELAHRADVRERTLAEGRALARIDHPNVVQLKAVVVDGQKLWLVMQYVEGDSLEQRIVRRLEEGHPMPVAEALGIFRQILSGMAAAHHEGVIHRDLKPANILIRAKDGIAKVSDFGIAKGEDDARAGRGQTKGVVGSLWYMSPEQVTGKRDLDKRVDIYALGVVLFEMLTGRVPFDAESSYEIMRMHAQAPMPHLSEHRADAPPGLDDVIQKACAKDREQRFQTCEDFLDALKKVDGGISPTKTVTASEIEPHRPSRASSRVWMLGVGLVVLGAAGTAALASAGVLPIEIPGLSPAPTRTTAPTTTRPTVPATGTTTATAPPTSEPAPLSLDSFAGPWVTENGRHLEGVVVAGALELRVAQVQEFELQGYQQGETRIVLRPVEQSPDRFRVEDRVRPLLPDGRKYELPNARSTCLALITKAKDGPLQARVEGQARIVVDFAKIEPGPNNFTFKKGEVESCVRLDRLAVARVPVVLTRP